MGQHFQLRHRRREKYYCTVLSSSFPGGNVWLLAAERDLCLTKKKKVGVTRRGLQIARQVSSDIPPRAPCNLAKEKQSTNEKLRICTTWPLLPSLHAALFSLHISRWKNEGIGGGWGTPKFSFQLIFSVGNRKKIFIAPATYNRTCQDGRLNLRNLGPFFTLGSFSFLRQIGCRVFKGRF